MDESSADKTEDKVGLDLLIWIAIILISLYRLLVLYFPFGLLDYLVPPGSDPVNHYQMVVQVMQGNYDIQYPLLFHYLVSMVSKITSANPIIIFKIIGPILAILPGIAIYLFLKNSFGRLVGFVGFVITLLASNYGLLAFADGNYPNMISGGFLMPLALMFLVFATKKKKISNYVWGLVIALVMILTHQLTVALFALILIAYLIVLMIWNSQEKIFPGLRRLTIFTIAFIVIGLLIVLLSPLKDLFMTVVSSVFKGGFVDDVAYIKPTNFSEYQYAVGSFVWSAGLLSLIYLIFLLSKPEEKNTRSAILLILVWFAVTFVLSRLSITGMPGRFARELAVPLVMAIAIMAVSVIRLNGNKIQKIIAAGFFGFIIVLNLVQVNGGAFSSPGYFDKIIWFTHQDKEKTDYFKLATKPTDVIISNRTTPYLPIFANRKIIFDIETYINNQSLPVYFKDENAKYLFIGNITKANPESEAYPFFRGFAKSTELLNDFVKKNNYPIAHSFSDGSVLYYIPQSEI